MKLYLCSGLMTSCSSFIRIIFQIFFDTIEYKTSRINPKTLLQCVTKGMSLLETATALCVLSGCTKWDKATRLVQYVLRVNPPREEDPLIHLIAVSTTGVLQN